MNHEYMYDFRFLAEEANHPNGRVMDMSILYTALPFCCRGTCGVRMLVLWLRQFRDVQSYANLMSLTQVAEWKDTPTVLPVKMKNTGDQDTTKKQMRRLVSLLFLINGGYNSAHVLQ
jgi:hypothetical protein